jgi:hypothetical protein
MGSAEVVEGWPFLHSRLKSHLCRHPHFFTRVVSLGTGLHCSHPHAHVTGSGLLPLTEVMVQEEPSSVPYIVGALRRAIVPYGRLGAQSVLGGPAEGQESFILYVIGRSTLAAHRGARVRA